MERNECVIEKVVVRHIRIPNDKAYGDAIQKFTALELPMVWITDRSGNTGVGFSYTIGRGGSTVVELLQAELSDQLIGQDSSQIETLMHTLKGSIHSLTPGCLSSLALSAVDVALWDLAAKRARTPLSTYLGGAKKRVAIYNTHVGWLSRPLEEVVELSEQAVRRDQFRALKLKVGKKDPAEDEERVAKVRASVGPEIQLMLDANQSWTLDQAIKRLRAFERYDIVWIEEPLVATDVAGLKALGFHTSIARAGGESLYDLEYFFPNVAERALDILQPDVARIGGITPAMKVCHLAQAANLKVAPHVSPELSVVVACAVENSFFVEFIPQMEPVLKEHLKIQDGYALLSDRPGHGIVFDEAALEKYDVKR